MTSSQIRRSFLDFFKSKQHTIVPSSSLMPDSPNLLFTNAGMNQFVPIFLGQAKFPYTPSRAADTQKCIRAGGKHNDLDDVGLDTYHHTFFEMLGNWSFGDYFKREAIEWAWELVVEFWRFPPSRLYATVFCPYLGRPGWEEKWRQEMEQVVVVAMTSPDFIAPNPDASPFEIADQEAAMYWTKQFRAAGCDPFIHIIPGGKKDNFWMMGETGPCGPCSELHFDLTPGPRETDLAAQKAGSALVNQGTAECIEIWNLVFIQFNAEPGNRFTRLPARHVDTGMGFERVTSIIQGTKGLKDFANAKISNYETDIFRPIFDALEKLSGKKYGSTLPPSDLSTINSQQSTDVAFRVIADHIRTLTFSTTDDLPIDPGNTDRNYVLRRILRRAVLYGRTLGFHEPFFYKLVGSLANTMGDVFPELRARQKRAEDVIRVEEEAFNKTLDRGIELFEQPTESKFDFRGFILAEPAFPGANSPRYMHGAAMINAWRNDHPQHDDHLLFLLKAATGIPDDTIDELRKQTSSRTFGELIESLRDKPENAEFWKKFDHLLLNSVSGRKAFELYDTYGFPLDLTELMARERGLIVDKEGFEKLMEEQRNRARAAQKKTVITVADDVDLVAATKFVGFEKTKVPSHVLKTITQKDKWAVVLETSPFYAEMGGQVGDTGTISLGASFWKVIDTKKTHSTWLHIIEGGEPPAIGPVDFAEVDVTRRNAIQRHHTVTHLLHWALHEVVSKEATQKGSFVGPDKLTFDFNSASLTPAQVADIEKLVNERILENAGVSWTEVPFAEVKNRRDVMQFFGDKYGDTVRVVQIGGHASKLDGYSMELCGGTHTRATGEIGLFRIVSESAIAAGVRRIEAIAGLEAYRKAADEVALIKTLAGKVNSPIHELEKKVESLLAHQKALEKEVEIALQRNASNAASELLGHAHTVNGIPLITHNLGDANGDFLQAIADSLKGRFKGVVVLGGASNGAVSLVASVSPDFTTKVQAGKIIQQIAPIVGGKGGGKPDNARGGGKDASKLDEALAKAKTLL